MESKEEPVEVDVEAKPSCNGKKMLPDSLSGLSFAVLGLLLCIPPYILPLESLEIRVLKFKLGFYIALLGLTFSIVGRMISKESYKKIHNEPDKYYGGILTIIALIFSIFAIILNCVHCLLFA